MVAFTIGLIWPHSSTMQSAYVLDGDARTANLLRIAPRLPVVRLAALPRHVAERRLAQVLDHAGAQRVRDLVDQPRRQRALRIAVRNVAEATAAVRQRPNHEAGDVGHGPGE